MLENHLLISCSAFLGFTALVYACLSLLDPYRSRIRARLSELPCAGDSLNLATAQGSSATLTGSPKGASKWLTLFRGEDRAKLQHNLTKAGICNPAAVSRVFAARVLSTALPPTLAIAASLFGYFRMETALLIGCIAGATGSLLPGIWVGHAIARRQLQLRKSLPDFLDLMIVCLEGGLSLQETIRRVGEELKLVHPALGFELSIVQRDMELGASVDHALRRFASRTGDEAIRSLSTFIREAQRFGTNITEALRNHSEMLRAQREQNAEENAQKASVKILLPTLLLIFPAIFVVLVGPAIIQIQEAFGGR